MSEPKYDNDNISYGYLKKLLKKYSLNETITDENQDRGTISKVYIVPPNTPYYKGTILVYNNKIYKCNNTRKLGVFNWNDWDVVATNDSSLNKFIEDIYDVEKIQIQEQLDNKIETYYQEIDPALEWDVDLIKAKHVGDYWYRTSDDTQWRYCSYTNTSPITYGWRQVNVPSAIFDLINTKKSIYTSKPNKYKKNDMWIIEDDISDDDIPTSIDNPIKKGDWVFATQDSEIYDKSHWIKRDESIDIDYLKEHYYTTEEIDEKNKVISENFDSKIDKSKDDILLSVERDFVKEATYTKAINDFDTKIGTIENTVTQHSEDISSLRLDADAITSSVSSLTEVISGKDTYVLTDDTTFLSDKEYYTLNDSNEYVLLVEGTDYNVGDQINSSIYERKNIPGLEQELNESIDDLSKNTEEKLNEVRASIEIVTSTMMKQTAEAFEMLFTQTGIEDTVNQVKNILNNNTNDLNVISQYIKFKAGTIIIGANDSQSKLIIQKDRISFMTGDNESAYISQNQLYILDSTILRKLQLGKWITQEDEYGNLNTKWGGGNA